MEQKKEKVNCFKEFWISFKRWYFYVKSNIVMKPQVKNAKYQADLSEAKYRELEYEVKFMYTMQNLKHSDKEQKNQNKNGNTKSKKQGSR